MRKPFGSLLLPRRENHFTLAQVYDALSYCEDHRAEVEQNLQTNTPDTWCAALQQRLGHEAAGKLLGE